MRTREEYPQDMFPGCVPAVLIIPLMRIPGRCRYPQRYRCSSTSTSASAGSGVLGGSLAVRPALHIRSDVSIEYNGTPQNFASGATPPTWYTESL